MKLTPPKTITFAVSVLLGFLGLVGILVPSIPAIGGVFAIWLVVIGFILLVLGNFLKGL